MSLKLEQIRGVNIFDTPSDTLVIPVNCVGVMGAGLAKEFAVRYSDVYVQYRNACVNQHIFPGGCYPYRLNDKQGRRAYLVATKRHWVDPSTISMVQTGANSIRRTLEARLKDDPTTPIDIAIPALGCGCGRLEWSKVKSVLLQVFALWKPAGNVTIRLLDPMDPTKDIPNPLFDCNHY